MVSIVGMALAGFAIGYWLGHALLGLAGGAIVGALLHSRLRRGRRRRLSAPGSQPSLRQEIYTKSVVNLAAKLAKADGPVTRVEIDAFKRQFSIADKHMTVIGWWFNEARKNPDGFEQYATTLAAEFEREPRVLADVLEALHHIALADGRLHPAEKEFLETVAVIFGVADRPFVEDSADLVDDPHLLLGVEATASMAEIKAAWRRLAREHHPDTLTAKGMPPDYIELATRKMAAINNAYDRIRAERGG
jgi:DnaJ like chaperone protein